MNKPLMDFIHTFDFMNFDYINNLPNFEFSHVLI